MIYSAIDKLRKEVVALKIEKADKSKKVLIFEYQVLKQLQGTLYIPQSALGLPHICPVYDFVESEQPQGLNFIVMKLLGNFFYVYLLGKNLATVKKQKGKDFTPIFAIRLLV